MVRDIVGLMGRDGVVEVRKVLHFGSLNNVMKSVFGRSYVFGEGGDGCELEGLVSEGYHLLGVFNWSDHFPLLGWLDLQGVRYAHPSRFFSSHKIDLCNLFVS